MLVAEPRESIQVRSSEPIRAMRLRMGPEKSGGPTFTKATCGNKHNPSLNTNHAIQWHTDTESSDAPVSISRAPGERACSRPQNSSQCGSARFHPLGKTKLNYAQI